MHMPQALAPDGNGKSSAWCTSFLIQRGAATSPSHCVMDNYSRGAKHLSSLRGYSADCRAHTHLVESLRILPTVVRYMNKPTQDPEVLADCVAIVKNIALNQDYVSAVGFEPRMAGELHRIRG